MAQEEQSAIGAYQVLGRVKRDKIPEGSLFAEAGIDIPDDFDELDGDLVFVLHSDGIIRLESYSINNHGEIERIPILDQSNAPEETVEDFALDEKGEPDPPDTDTIRLEATGFGQDFRRSIGTVIHGGTENSVLQTRRLVIVFERNDTTGEAGARNTKKIPPGKHIQDIPAMTITKAYAVYAGQDVIPAISTAVHSGASQSHTYDFDQATRQRGGDPQYHIEKPLPSEIAQRQRQWTQDKSPTPDSSVPSVQIYPHRKPDTELPPRAA